MPIPFLFGCVFLPSVCVCVCVCVCALSPIQLIATLLTVAHQAPLPMEFFRQEYCSGLPFPPKRWNLYLLHLLHWQVDSLPLGHLGSLAPVLNK